MALELYSSVVRLYDLRFPSIITAPDRESFLVDDSTEAPPLRNCVGAGPAARGPSPHPSTLALELA